MLATLTSKNQLTLPVSGDAGFTVSDGIYPVAAPERLGQLLDGEP